jgi:hypothetical protein
MYQTSKSIQGGCAVSDGRECDQSDGMLLPRFFYIYKLRDACGMMPVWKTAARNYAVCFVMWMM